MHITSYGGTKPVPFNRAIMESGGATSNSATTRNSSANYTCQVASRVNCTSYNSIHQLSCLRALPLETILTAVVPYEFEVNPNSAVEVFQPVSPSRYLPDSPSKLLRAGRFAKNLDMISGWNENDGSLFSNRNISTSGQVVETVIAQGGSLTNATIRDMFDLYPLGSVSNNLSENVLAEYFRSAQIEQTFCSLVRVYLLFRLWLIT